MISTSANSIKTMMNAHIKNYCELKLDINRLFDIMNVLCFLNLSLNDANKQFLAEIKDKCSVTDFSLRTRQKGKT